MGRRVEVLVQSMLATKGPIAILTLVYRGVSWGLIVLLESLRTAEPNVRETDGWQRSGRNHRTRILERGLGN